MGVKNVGTIETVCMHHCVQKQPFSPCIKGNHFSLLVLIDEKDIGNNRIYNGNTSVENDDTDGSKRQLKMKNTKMKKLATDSKK